MAISTGVRAIDKRAARCWPRRAQFHALPPDQFPSLTQVADYVTTDDATAVFELGVQLMLRGLEQLT